eukprot:9675016-Alexandrium_andersonii.AAC.1
MSASLVGSEMCIRDSSQGGHYGKGYIRVCDSDTPPTGRCLHLCDRSGTVSYTHLTLPTICSV